jgi:hypothetical protein
MRPMRQKHLCNTEGEEHMRDTIELAREAGFKEHNGMVYVTTINDDCAKEIERFKALVRADEREQGQKWFDAVTAQHKQEILAEREACAKLAQSTVCDTHIPTGVKIYGTVAAKAIRARSKP